MFTLTMEWWAPSSLSHTMNEPCMNDKCNVNSQNECMTPRKPNMVWHPNGIQLQGNNQCIP